MQLDARAEITNVNPRGQLRGPEEKDLAVDVNFRCTINFDDCKPLFAGIVTNVDDFKKAMWSDDEVPIALWPDLPLPFKVKYDNQELVMKSPFHDKGSNEELFRTDGCTLCKFKGKMKNAHQLEVTFQMQQVVPGSVVGKLCDLMIDGDVHITAGDSQQDLDFDGEAKD